MRKIAILIMLVLVASTSFAQKMPDWVTHKPTPTNDTYLYVVESATAETELSARNQAFARLFQSTAMRLGQPINSDEINKAVQRGTDFNVISAYYNIPINKVCEYTEQKAGKYQVYILCQVAKAGNIPVQFDDFNDCYEGANKFYASEALASDGFCVYKNNRLIRDTEVRSLLANSHAYLFYEKGMSIGKSSFWINDNIGELAASEFIGYLVLVVGATSAVMGYSFSALEEDPEKAASNASAGSVGLGITAIAGAIFLVRFGVITYGKANVRKAVNMYNNGKMYAQNSLELEYGFTGTGFGLTLHF